MLRAVRLFVGNETMLSGCFWLWIPDVVDCDMFIGRRRDAPLLRLRKKEKRGPLPLSSSAEVEVPPAATFLDQGILCHLRARRLKH